jgi:hypothetical protein
LGRHREFRREERLKIYGEFIEGFLGTVRLGVGLMSIYLSLGDTMLGEHREQYQEPLKEWGKVVSGYQNALARLRLVASDSARRAADDLNNFVERNILAVPPFTLIIEAKDMASWGAAAKTGPRAVQEEGNRLAREFTDRASRDITAWHERSRHKRGAAPTA